MRVLAGEADAGEAAALRSTLEGVVRALKASEGLEEPGEPPGARRVGKGG